MFVGGRQPPAHRMRQSTVVIHPYNNQKVVGRQGGVIARCLSGGEWARRDASRLTNVSHRRASDEGTAIHRRERRPPYPEDEIGGRAQLRWLWEAHWGGKSVIIWRLFSARVDDAPRLCIANK
jgi:hypothetical protein